jgi:hypothetical protein
MNSPNHPADFKVMDWRWYSQIALELRVLGNIVYNGRGIPVHTAVHAAGGTTASFAFDYQYVGTGLTSDTLVKTAVSSNTFNLSAANKIHVIEVLASDLTAGYTHLRCEVASPGSNADLLAMAYILYQGSYVEGVASQPSVIA